MENFTLLVLGIMAVYFIVCIGVSVLIGRMIRVGKGPVSESDFKLKEPDPIIDQARYLTALMVATELHARLLIVDGDYLGTDENIAYCELMDDYDKRAEGEVEKCNHDWELIDASYDPEWGDSRLFFKRCLICGVEKEYESPTFDIDTI